MSIALIRTELNSPTSRSENRLTEVRQGHMVRGLAGSQAASCMEHESLPL